VAQSNSSLSENGSSVNRCRPTNDEAPAECEGNPIGSSGQPEIAVKVAASDVGF
jgi:hypothetical protein